MSKINCFDVAKYFLSRVNEEYDERLSNLKLQKLLYYAQGFHLALFNKSLFNEKIEAWEHGPVVPDIYYEYKRYGARGIPTPGNIDFDKYDNKTTELLDEIYDVFGQFSAWKLRNFTHAEPPWIKAMKSKSKVIIKKSMKEYFKKRIK